MPIYEYECLDCGHRFERITTLGEANPLCPACSVGKVKKQVAAFRTNAWSSFLDTMEKGVSPQKFK